MGQFFKFLLSGGLAAFLNWSSRFLFSQWLPFEYAVVAAFFVGLSSGFLIMRCFVFQGRKKPAKQQAFNYFIINMLALLQTLAISVALVRWAFPAWGIIEQQEALAHLAGVLAPVITSYFGHKYFTFS
jgi:putative flippase GtrA